MKSVKKIQKNHTHTILLWIIIVNIIILDLILLRSLFQTNPNVLGVNTKITDQACPQSCITKFKEYAVTTSSGAKEQYISLGTGSGYSSDWIDLAGIEATIDTTQYRKIKTVTFDATVSPQTGNGIVWVRLFNATDKHPVWYSDLSMSGAGPVVLTSKPITLDEGKKLYKVQIKTQLSYPVSVLQSRIHILTY